MRTSNVNFLSTVSEDNVSDDEHNALTSYSSLSSVSQSANYSNAISRFCELASRGMKKMPLLGNAVLLSAIFSHFVKSADADILDDPDLVVLKEEVCEMFFIKSVTDYLNNRTEFTEQGYFPSIDVRSELLSLGDNGFDSISSLVSYVNGYEPEALDVLMELGDKSQEMTGKLSRTLSSLGVDMDSLPFNFDHGRDDINGSCPGLAEFFEKELNPTTTIATTAITTTTVPAVPVTFTVMTTTELTSSSSTEGSPTTAIVMISVASLLMFAFVSFLIGAACSRVKKRGSAKSVCGRSRREENEGRNSFELVEIRASSSAQVEAPKQEEAVVMMASGADAEEVEDLV